MTDFKATVVIPYFGDRTQQLARTLWLLERQTFPVRVIVGDDGEWLPRDFPVGPSTLILKVRPRGTVRPMNFPVRAAWPLVETDYCVIAHPENMAPLDAVERMMTQHVDGRRDVPIVYGLNRETSEHLDDYPWQTDFQCLLLLPGFMQWTNPLRQWNSEAHGNCHHLNFSGAYRDEWTRFDKLVLPFKEKPASDEDWLRAKEVEAGCLPRQVPDGLFVYHQHHPRVDWWQNKPVGQVVFSARTAEANRREETDWQPD